MEIEKYKNALDEFLLLTSSFENHLKGYSDFETVELFTNDNVNNTCKSTNYSTNNSAIIGTVNSAIKSTIKLTTESNTNIKSTSIDSKIEQFLKKNGEEPSLTPFMLKKEFLSCRKCSLASDYRVLSEGDLSLSLVFVLTDNLLTDEERTYLDKVLSSVHLEVGKNAYLTSVLKCKSDKKATNDDYKACSHFIGMQASLSKCRAFIAFGKEATETLKELKKTSSFDFFACIYAPSLNELKNDSSSKARLWNSLKKLTIFLNLPRV